MRKNIFNQPLQLPYFLPYILKGVPYFSFDRLVEDKTADLARIMGHPVGPTIPATLRIVMSRLYSFT